MKNMTDSHEVLFEAIAFAARAHRHQIRKDGLTPYVSHPVRVMTVASLLFGVSDPKALAAAVLHDTIEDTTTDYDNLAERFGSDVASWVSCLTKEMRLPEEQREREYLARLAVAPWPVVIGKLADLYDNLSDSRTLSPQHRERTVQRTEECLSAFRGAMPREAVEAFRITEARLAEVKQLLTK